MKSIDFTAQRLENMQYQKQDEEPAAIIARNNYFKEKYMQACKMHGADDEEKESNRSESSEDEEAKEQARRNAERAAMGLGVTARPGEKTDNKEKELRDLKK